MNSQAGDNCRAVSLPQLGVAARHSRQRRRPPERFHQGATRGGMPELRLLVAERSDGILGDGFGNQG